MANVLTAGTRETYRAGYKARYHDGTVGGTR